MKLFTDIDLDGLGCGVLAKLAFGEEASVSYCSYRNLNQRVEQFLDNPDLNKEEVYITDMAVNELVEKRLDERFQEGQPIHLIDHHITALHFNQYKWAMVQPEYQTGKKTCATSLFYDHLVEKKKIERTNALDQFVDLIRQYDTWEWEENNKIAAKRLNSLFYMVEREQFEQEIMKRLKANPEAFTLTETENLLLDVEDKKIERYIRSKNRHLVQTFIGEYCVGITHAEQYLSELGNTLNKLNPHLDMIIMLNVGGKKVGLRTIHDYVNVAEFASKFGGGGHPKASGCDLTKEAFEKFVVNVFDLPPLKPDPERNEFNVKGAPFGTAYENRNGEISYIRPLPDGAFEIIHDGKKLEEQFPTFEAAEHHLKRQFASWLRYDHDCLNHMVATFSKSVEEVKADYENIMKNMLDSIE
jgi:oligoribonuclease NrnB/cAMP/cGMP phosphodiesterase (DHH superfamily)